MAGEREPFATKELRGVTYTENNAASLLEQHLGIVIPDHPKTVVLTPRNRLALYRDPEFRQSKNFSRLNVLLKDSIEFAGYYASEFNTCILKQKPKENGNMTSLHETMHAFIDQTNPDIPLYIKRAFAQGTQNVLDFNYDVIEAYQIFQEGIASWGELETTELIKNKTKTGRDEQHQKQIETLLQYIRKENIHQNFAGIRERVDLWRQSINDIYNPVFKKDDKKYKNLFRNRSIQTAVYGHYFVHQVLSKLTGEGFTTGDALRLLVLHPPEWPRALDQLEDPIAFADELIVYYIRERGRIPKEN